MTLRPRVITCPEALNKNTSYGDV
ncbi:MAG: hypothetical protein QOH44_1127, partial [Actinomycetota bacterium]|nr:hypothetical protein [Actinomycetota bacterium]